MFSIFSEEICQNFVIIIISMYFDSQFGFSYFSWYFLVSRICIKFWSRPYLYSFIFAENGAT